MLCNGEFILIPKPDRDYNYGDECVIVRITNKINKFIYFDLLKNISML